MPEIDPSQMTPFELSDEERSMVVRFRQVMQNRNDFREATAGKIIFQPAFDHGKARREKIAVVVYPMFVRMGDNFEIVATEAVKAADALIAELDKPTEKP